MQTGIRFDYIQPDLDLMEKNSISFVVRDVTHPFDDAVLTKADADEYHKVGINIVTLYDAVPRRHLGDVQAGFYDGATAQRLAQDAAIPEGRPIFYSLEFGWEENEFPLVEGYIKGLRQAHGGRPVGIATKEKYLYQLVSAGLADYYMQCLDSGTTAYATAAALRQTSGNESWGSYHVDRWEAAADDYGQWFLSRPADKAADVPGLPLTQAATGGMPTLAQGHASTDAGPTYTRIVQSLLVANGLAPHLAVDGTFGPDTDQAVRNWQSEHQLPVTGVVDTATWTTLLNATSG